MYERSNEQQASKQAVSMDEACSLFRQGVTSVFKQWMVLHLAVTNNWGGGDSYRKATLLLEETLRLFVPPPLARTAHRPKKLPTPEELEEKLGDYMEEQFGTLVEDGSLEEVSAWVCNLWEECKEGRREGVTKVCAQEAAVLRLQQRWSELSREASLIEEDVRRSQEGEEELWDEEEEGGGRGCQARGEEDGKGMEVERGDADAGSMENGAGKAHVGGAEEEEEEEEGWTTVKTKKKAPNPRQRRREPGLFG